MKATISEVDIFIMVYAWSQKGLAYMVSSCGTTVQHDTPYRSKFDDGFGNTDFRELPRPAIAHFLYEFLPLIDEHNKTRQNALALEKCWLIKDCWFRVATTLTGMAVVDLQRWDRNMRHKDDKLPVSVRFDNNKYETSHDIKMIANYIARGLDRKDLGYYRDRDRQQPPRRKTTGVDKCNIDDNDDEDFPFVRVTGKNGEHTYNNTNNNIQVRCFICRQYKRGPSLTQWKCKQCGMPLCNVDHPGRQLCVREHLDETKDEIIGCSFIHRQAFTMPNGYLKYTANDPANKTAITRRETPGTEAPETKSQHEAESQQQKRKRKTEIESLVIEDAGPVCPSTKTLRRTPRINANAPQFHV